MKTPHVRAFQTTMELIQSEHNALVLSQPVASPATGHWGTCPTQLPTIFKFFSSLSAVQSPTATVCGCLSKHCVFCDTNYDSSDVATWTTLHLPSVAVSFHFASAAVAVDSSHMTESSSTLWRRFSLPSKCFSGQVSTMLFMVCRWPQSLEGDWLRPHLCRFAQHGLWPVRKRFNGDHVRRGTSKPGCRIVGSVTILWSTTEADDLSSLHCVTVSTDVMSDHIGYGDASRGGCFVCRLFRWLEFNVPFQHKYKGTEMVQVTSLRRTLVSSP